MVYDAVVKTFALWIRMQTDADLMVEKIENTGADQLALLELNLNIFVYSTPLSIFSN